MTRTRERPGTGVLRRAALLALGLTLGTLIVGALSAPAGAHDRREYYVRDRSIHTHHPEWMRWIPDNTSLARMSIPGTHDTMADAGWGDSVETQGLGLRAQLDAGIRALDIRARCVNDNGLDTFKIYHGAFSLDAEFGVDVRDVILTFLREHPSETVLMRLDNEHTGTTPNRCVAEFHQVWERYWRESRSLWYADTLNDAIPTLGQVRGKIVMLRGFAGTADGIAYVDNPNLAIQDEWEVCEVEVAGCDNTIGEKWELVRQHAVNANDSTDQRLFINYLSGSTLANPNRVAGGDGAAVRGVNDYALDWLADGHGSVVGTWMMDFPGARLIDELIERSTAVYRQYTVGVLADGGCGDTAPSERVAIRMDDEDDENASHAWGWIGRSRSDRNTTMEFCRANGLLFHRPTSGSYALLSLGSSCPPDSLYFRRHFDNEDSDNRNSRVGVIHPVWQERNTELLFCVFRAQDGPSTMPQFPDLGHPYGVFAAPSFPFAMAVGGIHTDDEDDDNANSHYDWGITGVADGIVETGRNTNMWLAKVRGLSSTSTLSVDGGSPSIEGRPLTLRVAVAGSGGTPTGNVRVAAPGQFDVTVPLQNGAGSVTVLADAGTHELVATYSGDTIHSRSSTTLTHVVEPDTVAPTVAFALPAPGATVNAALWDGSCGPAVCGWANDAGTGVRQVNLSVRGPAGYWSGTGFVADERWLVDGPGRFADADNEYLWSVNIPTEHLVDGTYSVRAYATDSAGNAGHTTTMQFTFDNTGPTAASTFPTAGAAYSKSSWSSGCSPAGICGTADGTGSTVASVAVSVRDGEGRHWDGSSFRGTRPRFVPVSASGSWSLFLPLLDETTYAWSVRVTDAAGNETITAEQSFTYDETRPIVVPGFPLEDRFYRASTYDSGCGIPGLCGTASDAASGIAGVSVSVRDGLGRYWNGTAFVDATPRFLPAIGTTAWSFPLSRSALAEGTYEVELRATDRAGNVRSGVYDFGFDTVSPSVSILTDTEPDGANGWYRTSPEFHMLGTDATSGIEWCDPPRTYAGPDGRSLSLTGRCIDRAGNEASATSPLFMLDRNPPAATVDLVGSPDGNDDWYLHAPRLRTSGADSLSAVECTPEREYAGVDGDSLSGTGICTDEAGNSTEAVSEPFKLDRLGPMVQVVVTTEPDGDNGWYVSAPQFAVSASDATSGVAGCEPATTYGGSDGEGITVSRTCGDVAGNQATSASAPFSLDRVPPVVTVAPTTAPDGDDGWYVSAPVFTARGTDATSGIAACDDARQYDGPDGRDVAVSLGCTDVAGHRTVSASEGVRLDREAPTVECPPRPRYVVGSTPTLEAVVEDTLSGPLSSRVAQPVPANTVGEFVVEVAGSDVAGNVGRATCDYDVGYGIRLLYDSTRARQSGSTVPIKLALVDAAGTSVSNADVAVTIESIDPAPPDDTASGSAFMFVSSDGGGHHQFDLKTKGFPAGTYRIWVRAGADPAIHEAPLVLRDRSG